MTDTDKTREKLLSSIRKTKAGVAAKSEQPSPAQGAPKRRKAVSPEASPAEKPASPRPAPRKARRGTEQQQTRDPYQSGRRIWPD